LHGTSFGGEKFKLTKEVQELFTPMALEAFYELQQDSGLSPLFFGAGLYNLFGGGVQTYGGLKPEVRKFLKGETDAKSLLQLDSFDLNGLMFQKELKKLPPEQANQLLDKIEAASEDSALSTREKRKLKNILSEVGAEAMFERNQITSEERGMVGAPVESRVEWLVKKLNSLKSKEEKNALLDRYEELGILTDVVSEELAIAKRDGKLKSEDTSSIEKITTRELDGFPFPDYESSSPGQILRADLNLQGKGEADIVFHLKTSDGKVLDVPQTKETLTDQKGPYGLQINIPKDAPSGEAEVWVTVNGKEVPNTRRKHKIVSTSPDRYPNYK